MFWKYSRKSNYFKRHTLPVLNFANSEKCSDDGGVKKQTNAAMEDFGKCYIYLLVIFYNYKIQKQ